MNRVTIRVLPVRGTSDSKTSTSLTPGTVLHDCKVVRNGQADEPYQVHFMAEGNQYTCPLYQFQPRTECWTGEAHRPQAAEAHRGVA